jgi:hypothetical protein
MPRIGPERTVNVNFLIGNNTNPTVIFPKRVGVDGAVIMR